MDYEESLFFGKFEVAVHVWRCDYWISVALLLVQVQAVHAMGCYE